MILHALKEYYDRKAADPASRMAAPGWEWKEIPYVVVLAHDGRPVAVECTWEGTGEERRAKAFLLPQSVKRSSGIKSNLFWDNPEYALGVVLKGKPNRVKEQHAAFRKAISSLNLSDDEGVRALEAFLDRSNKKETLAEFGESWEELLQSGLNVTFRLAGDALPIANRPVVRRAIDALADSEIGAKAVCLVTGEYAPIERLHASIKGVWGANTRGGDIVSFNRDAFESFGKKQGSNAPVSKNVAFAYTTALNHLLRKDSSQRVQVGDASTVFWASRDCRFESEVAAFFGEPPKDDPDRGVRAVEDLLRSVNTGAYVESDKETRFYVLGLAPNAARIAIRFWHVGTVPEMAQRFAQHFRDLRLVHGPKDKDTLSLFRLLVATAVQGKAENIPPNLAGDTIRAILEGLPYPATLLEAAVRRARAEHEISYARAALIKASINRQTRFHNPHIEEELKMALDPENSSVGYRLGRLFATLEKIQQDANPGINATIRDRFYGAASSTPIAVFGNLMRLKNHHLSKLPEGLRIVRERLIGEIMSGIADFPAHLPLADQGRFAIGYYHQMQDFYTKRTDKNE
ncbi:MAG TPA: type I-C CRISPR-associated protein Cas8c/Csd1 [Phycisphaerae bacterium]|nr:type I-C CRISPR-associated protein Cas8c/Csd1 [Phycisphaerae bacterium]